MEVKEGSVNLLENLRSCCVRNKDFILWPRSQIWLMSIHLLDSFLNFQSQVGNNFTSNQNSVRNWNCSVCSKMMGKSNRFNIAWARRIGENAIQRMKNRAWWSCLELSLLAVWIYDKFLWSVHTITGLSVPSKRCFHFSSANFTDSNSLFPKSKLLAEEDNQWEEKAHIWRLLSGPVY